MMAGFACPEDYYYCRGTCSACHQAINAKQILSVELGFLRLEQVTAVASSS